MAADSMHEEFVKLAKHHKMAWVENTNEGDMPPTVIGLRGGKPILLVIAPQVDKHQGLQAANLLRRGLGIDGIVFITDAHTMLTKGRTLEETKALYEKYREPGSMQKACDEEDACNLGEIADCLCVHHIGSDLKFNMRTYPYFYHGKEGGAEFRWMEEHNSEMLDCPIVENAEPFKDKQEHEAIVSGLIPNTLKRILQQPTPLETPEIQSMMKAIGADINDPEDVKQAMKHMEIASRRAMESQGFMIMDCIEYNGSYEDFLKQMAHKYEVIEKAKSFKEPTPEEMTQLLNQLEEHATEPEELAQIKELKERLENYGR